MSNTLGKWKMLLNVSVVAEWFFSSQRDWSNHTLKPYFWSFNWSRTLWVGQCRLIFLQMWFLTVKGPACLLWVCILTLYFYSKRTLSVCCCILSANISPLKVTFWARPLAIWTLSLRCLTVVESRTWSILLQIFMFSSTWEAPSRPMNGPATKLWATWWKVNIV